MVRYIIFAPLVGAAINWLVGRRVRSERFIGIVACTSVAVSTVFAFALAFGPEGVLRSEEPRVIFDHLWIWLQVGEFRADFGFAMDRLSGIYACFVTFVGFLIHVFATGYMHGDKGFYRFFSYLNLFMFMMLTLVLADNLLLMFVGWEGVGLCSYLLIGYYIERKDAGDAAKKAFVVNRIGDWGVVMGIMLIFFLTQSISFFDKPAAVTGGTAVASALAKIAAMPIEPFTLGSIIAGGITSAGVLLFIGATGKSAQLPLYTWLPDAMAGPTPVSALIHAATMVTAGVYLVVRCSPIYTHAPTALFIVALVGALTAIFAATIGLAQNDIKKVLAYSTVSQLGYMFLACGVGAFVAAIFHVMTHAFFKALLFLGSGSVIHGMHHEQDMRRMGGLRKYMKITFVAMIAGWFAICGIPIFAGFFSKDEILWKTFSTHAPGIPEGFATVLWAIAAVTALLTAIYMTRLMIMTFWGDERFADAHAPSEGHAHEDSSRVAHVEEDEHHHHGPVHPHESPWTMTVPLIVLAILSTLGGLVGIPYALSGGVVPNYFEKTLEPAVAHVPSGAEGSSHEAASPAVGHGANDASNPQSHVAESPSPSTAAASSHETAHSPEEIRTERLFTLLSVAIAAAGIGIGVWLFRRTPLRPMPELLENKYYVDEVYDAAFVTPIKEGSRSFLWRFFDLGVIDGAVNGLGWLVKQSAGVIRYLQPGFVRSYAAIILLGALAVVGFFAYSAFRSMQ
jgi:NADH-quinone oxidoreductase subunit L